MKSPYHQAYSQKRLSSYEGTPYKRQIAHNKIALLTSANLEKRLHMYEVPDY